MTRYSKMFRTNVTALGESRGLLRGGTAQLCAVVLVAHASFAPLAAQEMLGNGTRHQVPSSLFEQSRTVRVSVPPAYETDTTRYPVLVHLDGDSKFDLVAATVRFLARSGRIPEMVVVGIENPDSRARTRDLTPDADAEYPGSGGAATMARFVGEELLPWIDRSYRTTGRRVLVGHSFGGLFTLHMLASAPQHFDAYISAGASLWLDNGAFAQRLESSRLVTLDRPTWLYFTAGEGDGGNTLPSNKSLAVELKQLSPNHLAWHFAATDEENHFSNLPITLHRGLLALFPIWGATDDLRAVASTSPDGARQWFAQRRLTLGWRDVLPDFEVHVVGYQLLQAGHTDASLAVFTALGERSPQYASGWEGQGRVLERLDRPAEALAAYRRAVAAATASGEPEYLRDRMRGHVERLAR